MKLVGTLLLCFGVTLAPNPQVKTENNPLGYHPATIADDLVAIFIDHTNFILLAVVIEVGLLTDPAVSANLQYMQSDQFQNYCVTIAAKQEMQDFQAFLLDRGSDVAGVLAAVNDILMGISSDAEPDPSASLLPFINDFLGCVDIDGLVATMEDKLNTSPVFQELWVYISGETARAFWSEVLQEDEARHIGSLLRRMHVHIDSIIADVWFALGWGEPPLE